MATEDEMVRYHHWLMDMNVRTLQEIVEDRGAWHAAIHRVKKNWT